MKTKLGRITVVSIGHIDHEYSYTCTIHAKVTIDDVEYDAFYDDDKCNLIIRDKNGKEVEFDHSTKAVLETKLDECIWAKDNF